MKYLIDTSYVAYYLRDDVEAVRLLLLLKDEGLAISVVTLSELHEGVYRARDPQTAERVLQGFLSEVSVLAVNEEIARVFGRERARLRQLGTPMSDLDLLIASTPTSRPDPCYRRPWV